MLSRRDAGSYYADWRLFAELLRRPPVVSGNSWRPASAAAFSAALGS